MATLKEKLARIWEEILWQFYYDYEAVAFLTATDLWVWQEEGKVTKYWYEDDQCWSKEMAITGKVRVYLRGDLLRSHRYRFYPFCRDLPKMLPHLTAVAFRGHELIVRSVVRVKTDKTYAVEQELLAELKSGMLELSLTESD